MACTAPTIVVGGVTLSTSDFENANDLLNTVSGDQGDPTLDGYEENIGNGNTASGKTGVQVPNNNTVGNMPSGQQQTSLPTPSPYPADQSNDKAPPGGNGTAVTPTVWSGNYDEYLSTNFKVRDFTVDAVFKNPLVDYDLTYTAQVRFNNLRALAVNVIEPLYAKFGAFSPTRPRLINSGIRNKNSTASGLSQHVTGQACDIQFAGWSYARYWENAQWVKDNIPYDQFIFEHSSSTGLAWYHLSFNNAGNRSPSLPTKVMTMYRNHYDSGLKRYG